MEEIERSERTIPIPLFSVPFQLVNSVPSDLSTSIRKYSATEVAFAAIFYDRKLLSFETININVNVLNLQTDIEK